MCLSTVVDGLMEDLSSGHIIRPSISTSKGIPDAHILSSDQPGHRKICRHHHLSRLPHEGSSLSLFVFSWILTKDKDFCSLDDLIGDEAFPVLIEGASLA